MQSNNFHFFPFPVTRQHNTGTLWNKSTNEFNHIPPLTLSLELVVVNVCSTDRRSSQKSHQDEVGGSLEVTGTGLDLIGWVLWV